MVIDEYDQFHQALQQLVKSSNDMKDEDREKLNKFIGELTNSESDIYSPLMTGDDFIIILRNLVLLNMSQLADSVDFKLIERRDMLREKMIEVQGMFAK